MYIQDYKHSTLTLTLTTQLSPWVYVHHGLPYFNPYLLTARRYSIFYEEGKGNTKIWTKGGFTGWKSKHLVEGDGEKISGIERQIEDISSNVAGCIEENKPFVYFFTFSSASPTSLLVFLKTGIGFTCFLVTTISPLSIIYLSHSKRLSWIFLPLWLGIEI